MCASSSTEPISNLAIELRSACACVPVCGCVCVGVCTRVCVSVCATYAHTTHCTGKSEPMHRLKSVPVVYMLHVVWCVCVCVCLVRVRSPCACMHAFSESHDRASALGGNTIRRCPELFSVSVLVYVPCARMCMHVHAHMPSGALTHFRSALAAFCGCHTRCMQGLQVQRAHVFRSITCIACISCRSFDRSHTVSSSARIHVVRSIDSMHCMQSVCCLYFRVGDLE